MLTLAVIGVVLIVSIGMFGLTANITGNTDYVDEYVGNVTNARSTGAFFNVQNTPVYFGQTFAATGEANATVRIVNQSGLSTTLTNTCCVVAPTSTDVFNISSGGRIFINSTVNGTVLVSYTVEKLNPAAATGMRSVVSQGNSSFVLAAIIGVVIAAGLIIATLFIYFKG